MSIAYRIEDEPRPSPLSHLTVNPFWPLLGVMLGGVWIAWPWSILNGFAFGSPTRWKEVGLVAAGLAGITVIWVGGANALALAGMTDGLAPKFLALAAVVWKLGVSYWIYTLQSRSFGIYEYYDGIVRNGLMVVIIAAVAASRVLGALPTWVRVIVQ